MRKRWIAAIVVVVVALGSAGVLAAGGTLSDPLVSLEYVSGSYKTSLMSQVDQQVDTVYSKGYAVAEQKLIQQIDALRNQVGTTEDGWSYRHEFFMQKHSLEDTVTLKAGSSLLLLEGAATAEGKGTDLIDATTGTATQNVALQSGHRYLVGENGTVTVTITSDAAILSVAGYERAQVSGKDAMPFTDTPMSAWYYEAVRHVYGQKLFQGLNENHFAPGHSVTRGMLATVLHRLAGEPVGTGEKGSFTDVASGQWYEAGVNWGADSGVISGMGNGLFAPNSNVTREQLAVMLYRYAVDYRKMNVQEDGDVSRFQDSKDISGWAEEGISWAVGVGILGGDTAGKLNPGGSATRAEAATMIQRFSKLLS